MFGGVKLTDILSQIRAKKHRQLSQLDIPANDFFKQRTAASSFENPKGQGGLSGGSKKLFDQSFSDIIPGFMEPEQSGSL